MLRVSQSIDLAIEATAESFLRNPANYSDERALAEDVRSRLNVLFQPVTVDPVAVEESSGARGKITDHKAYTANYYDTTEIDRAQCEVGGSAFSFGDHERLDVGVFADSISIQIVGGTQEFDPDDLSGVLEFKYVKNINYLRYRPEDENSKYRNIVDDIQRLGEFPDHVGARCLVFANYDLLRRDSGTKAEQALRDLGERCGVNIRFVLPSPRQLED